MKTIWLLLNVAISSVVVKAGIPNTDTLYISPSHVVEVGKEMVVYTDSTNQLNASMVLKKFEDQQGFRPIAPNPNFGIANATFWSLFTIKNSSSKPLQLFAHIDNFLMDTTRCYVVSKGKISLIGQAGDYLPFASRTVQNRNILYPISLNPKEAKTLLISVFKDQSSISIPIKIWPQPKFYAIDTRETLLYGLYFGIMVLVLVYSLVLFVHTRKALLLLYFMYVLLLSLFQFNHLGFAIQYLWPNSSFMPNFGFWIFGVFMTVFFVLFSLEFTQIKQTVPLLDFYFKMIAALLVVFAFSILLFSGSLHQYTSIAKKLYYYIQLSSALGFVLLIIFILKTGSVEGRYFALAFTTLISFGVVYMFREMGWIAYNTFTQNALILGSLIEVLIFSFGITHIVNKAFKDRQRMSEEIQKQQEKLMMATIETEEKERQRISAELHDSVGSQLSYLKSILEQDTTKQRPQKAITQVDEIAQNIRTISHDMTPVVLQMEGLQIAIENMVEKLNATTQTQFSLEWYDIPEEIPVLKSVTMYRIVQEALTNIVKHAQATHAFITFTGYVNEISITVEDDGVGFANQAAEGIGLKTMENRVQQLQGTFEISSILNNGTSIIVAIPIY